jgi:NADH dehydrogenase/NADH:ubiquinone oxidoreductase 75 kD subunit (chain G)
LYVNLEGRVQSAFKASFPPGNAKEDWKILRALSDALNKPLKFNTIEQLRYKMFEFNPALKRVDQLPSIDVNTLGTENVEVIDSKVNYLPIDYYHSNEIAKSSKTMLECKIARQSFKKQERKINND